MAIWLKEGKSESEIIEADEEVKEEDKGAIDELASI